MSIRIRRRWILLTSCLFIGACSKETIIREVPASPSAEAGNEDNEAVDEDNDSLADPVDVEDGSNMVPGDSDSETDTEDDSNMVPGDNADQGDADADVDTDEDSDADADPDAQEEADSGTEEDEDLLDDPNESDEQTDGDEEDDSDSADAGDEVQDTTSDCEDTLPCEWTSEDGQFSVTLTSVDNIGAYERLLLNYSLETLHDTQISVNGGGLAVDADDISFQPGAQMLGGGVSGNAQSLLAGETLQGSIEFDKRSDASSLASWSVTIVDGGIARVPSFSNVPIGTITSDYADCEGSLPCIWMTPSGDVTITLTTAGGFTTSGRLSTTFTVTSDTTIDVAMEAGAMGISSAGTRFEGQTHALGTGNGYGKITAEAYAGYPLSGSVDFARTPITATALDDLSLILYQDDPVPRWNPRFVNVPVMP